MYVCTCVCVCVWVCVCVCVCVCACVYSTPLSIYSGLGFDRHLFALLKLAEKAKMDVPLFQDPAYTSGNHIILSTSTLSAEGVLIGGFAPVVPDGFGVGYHIYNNELGVHLTSYPDRDPKGFLENLERSFDDIHATLCDKALD